MSGIMQLLLASRPQAVPDPYFEYTTLLLPGNGTNGAQNNTFLDSSTNAFSITRNGNTTQGTFSPFSQTEWGNYFDGATATRLTMPSNTAFAFGTGAYTVEAWVYLSAHAATQTTVVDCGSATGSLNFSVLSTGALSLGVFGVGATLSSAGGAVTLNAWNHVAVVRESTASNATKLYVNGTAVATGTDTGNYTVTTTPAIGGLNSSGFTATGYISNVRLVKGTAVYTSNFTPPTTPLTAITNTSLLTCQSNRFIDNSTNNFTITRNGDVSVQAFSPFNPTAAWSAATNGGSGYFDGSGDYLTAANNAAWNFGTGDFTVELFAYVTSFSAGTTDVIVSTYQDASNGWTIGIFGSTGYFYGAAAGNSAQIDSTVAPSPQWNHLVLVRSGTTLSFFVNGARAGTLTNSTNISSTSALTIGTNVGGGALNFNGYMAGLRVVKGTAVYDPTQSTLTVPTAPVTAVTNTQLLLNYTNAGIYDATSKNDLETVGNAQISTAVSKFGGSSMYFDGTGDYLAKYIADPQTIFGTGDFTFECWVYPTTLNSYNMILGYASPNQYWSIRNTGYLHFYDGSTSYEATTNAVPLNQWTHIAISRSGSTLRQFVNGVQALSSTCATSIGAASALWFGASAAYPSQHFFTGYINDLRITKGYARYTANFTAPTAAFPLF